MAEFGNSDRAESCKLAGGGCGRDPVLLLLLLLLLLLVIKEEMTPPASDLHLEEEVEDKRVETRRMKQGLVNCWKLKRTHTIVKCR